MVSPSAPYGLTDLPKEVSTSLKLLIVEDESLVAVDLQERLIQLGYEVGAVVDNGTDALLYARTMKFDLVLMDIYIRGETDGIQTAAALREAMDVPVVFLTAHSDEATLDRAALSEPFGYLLKPFDERDLRATLQMAHYRHRAEARLSETLSRLTESNAALEEFASIASHDLQEPLRSMKGCAQLLERKYAGKLDHEADKLIGFIVNGSSRMKSLIEDLLTFAQAGRVAKLETIDTKEALEEALVSLSSVILESKAEVVSENLPSLRFNKGQFVRILQNLVGNAVKYRTAFTPPRVQVSGQRQGNAWIFSVADNGIGFEPEYTEEVFHVFKRLHHRAAYPGTGLGLAIVRKIVEQRGGKIWAESIVDRGTNFRFSVPDQEPELP
jgi:signal transduction histidine kinase